MSCWYSTTAYIFIALKRPNDGLGATKKSFIFRIPDIPLGEHGWPLKTILFWASQQTNTWFACSQKRCPFVSFCKNGAVPHVPQALWEGKCPAVGAYRSWRRKLWQYGGVQSRGRSGHVPCPQQSRGEAFPCKSRENRQTMYCQDTARWAKGSSQQR